MDYIINDFVNLIAENDGINDKEKLSKIVCSKFSLTQDRSVYYSDNFGVRFCKGKGPSFSNTVLSLSNLKKFDHLPFIVCLVTPSRNFLFMANSTFLKKISHSSHELRVNNIRGSFNGSDIVREFEGISNIPVNFNDLFNIHKDLGFEGNLPRLVEETNAISPVGIKFKPNNSQKSNILKAPERASEFINSNSYYELKADLDGKVAKFKKEIIIAGLIENVNIRGRIIEYIIAGESDILRSEIIEALNNQNKSVPEFQTDNQLGDYSCKFDKFVTETDIKTKIMILNSNPKAYNLDKMLEFLSTDNSVFLFYFVGIDPTEVTHTALISVFQTKLLNKTIVLRHWSGRNSRGVTQFEGATVGELLVSGDYDIDINNAIDFLNDILLL